jgi:hypothetical protein
MHRVLPPSEPPDGERPRFFRLVVVGGTQLRGSWYLSAIARLQGFSSGSPAASPCWGGGQAEPELYLPHGFVGHPLLQHSGERELTGLAEGADSDNAGLVGRERRQLQRVGLAGSAGSGSAPSAPSRRMSGHRAARTGGPPKTSGAARATFMFLGCPAFALVRRLCAEVGARPSERIRVGICRWADGFRRRR